MKKLKKIARKIHLWLALAASTTIFISLITGIVYIFKDDIQSSYQTLDGISPNSKRISIDSIENIITPKIGKLQSIKIYEGNNKPIVVSIIDKNKKRKYYYVNPYNAQIISERKLLGEDFFRFSLRLHRWLFMDDIGKVIMGTSTLILIFILLSGLILWLPKRIKNIRKRLTITAKKGNKLLYQNAYGAWILLLYNNISNGYDWIILVF